LPFLFFSFSHTKLSHYILPIYPPLAIFAGEAVARGLRNGSPTRKWLLWFPAVNLSLVLVLLGVAFYRRDILPSPLDSAMGEVYRNFPGVLILAVVLGIIWLISSGLKSVAKSERFLYLYCSAGFALYFCTAQPIVASVALASSSKIVAQKSAPLIKPEDQLVLYNDFRSSLPYYLNIERPLWFVWSGHGSSVMESWYILEKHVQPAAPYGKALITFEEFARLRETGKKRLLVFLRKKHIPQLIGGNAIPARILLDFGDYVLMSLDDAHHDPGDS
jgi:4-amino-4-deoxy-L-arabinose transferase-like glycosyltransferase